MYILLSWFNKIVWLFSSMMVNYIYSVLSFYYSIILWINLQWIAIHARWWNAILHKNPERMIRVAENVVDDRGLAELVRHPQLESKRCCERSSEPCRIRHRPVARVRLLRNGCRHFYFKTAAVLIRSEVIHNQFASEKGGHEMLG